jgi:hypothetical protein
MPILGSIILEFLGAMVRWIFLRSIGRKVTFRETWNGPNKSVRESLEYSVSNTIIGWFTIGILASILVWLVG